MINCGDFIGPIKNQTLIILSSISYNTSLGYFFFTASNKRIKKDRCLMDIKSPSVANNVYSVCLIMGVDDENVYFVYCFDNIENIITLNVW